MEQQQHNKVIEENGVRKVLVAHDIYPIFGRQVVDLQAALASCDSHLGFPWLQAICRYTWPGIEYGEPPSCSYTFFEYVDAVRFGDLNKFKLIEAATFAWWFPTLDRGAGALLHFAADHGQLDMARFLIQHRPIEINQQDNTKGWTPLHRCARVAHYQHAPFFQLFELLLQHGADPGITNFPSPDYPQGQTAIDVAVKKGYGWQEGEVRAKLEALIAQYAHMPKRPAYLYQGPPIGAVAFEVFQCWEDLPKLYPLTNWRGPPSAGHQGAAGMRLHEKEPWRPAGDGDGSMSLRPMTEMELAAQAEQC